MKKGLLDIQYRVLGALSTNVYFLINRETREVLLVDPADNADYILEQCRLRDYHLKAILLTHGHFDHIFAAAQLREKTGVPIYAHEEEVKLLGSANMNRSQVWATGITLQADVLLRDKQEIQLAGFIIRVLHTPGHTGGSCCYYFPEEDVLISGDTLFFESYGRTDLETGSTSAIMRSLKEVLFRLPDETEVYPGHMDATDIAHEKKYNPAAYSYDDF